MQVQCRGIWFGLTGTIYTLDAYIPCFKWFWPWSVWVDGWQFGTLRFFIGFGLGLVRFFGVDGVFFSESIFLDVLVSQLCLVLFTWVHGFLFFCFFGIQVEIVEPWCSLEPSLSPVEFRVFQVLQLPFLLLLLWNFRTARIYRRGTTLDATLSICKIFSYKSYSLCLMEFVRQGVQGLKKKNFCWQKS